MQVAERLGLDGADGEVAEQCVVGDAHRAAREVVHLRRVPDVVTGRRPAGRRPGRADLQLIGRRPDDRALSERGHPPPQVEAVRPGQSVRTGPGVKPRRVAQHGRRAARGHHDRGEPAAPVPPAALGQGPEQQERREQDQHRQALAAHVDGVADQQASQQRDWPRHPGPPQDQQHGQHDEEGEQGLGHDHVLVFDLEPVKQHGQRGRRGPARRHATAPQQQVDHDRDAQPHQVLHAGDQRQAVEGFECPQEQRVARRLGLVRPQPQRGAQVDVGVAGEPQRARVAEHGQQPQARAGRERRGEGGRGGGWGIARDKRAHTHHKRRADPHPGPFSSVTIPALTEMTRRLTQAYRKASCG